MCSEDNFTKTAFKVAKVKHNALRLVERSKVLFGGKQRGGLKGDGGTGWGLREGEIKAWEVKGRPSEPFHRLREYITAD